MYDPQTGCIREGVPQDISRTLRRRAYLIEKARNANIVGGNTLAHAHHAQGATVTCYVLPSPLLAKPSSAFHRRG